MKYKITYCRHPFDEFPTTHTSTGKTYEALVAALPDTITSAMIVDGDLTFKYPECAKEKPVNADIRIVGIPGGNKKIWKGILKGVASIALAAMTAGMSTLIKTGLYVYGAFKVLQGSIQLLYPVPKIGVGTVPEQDKFKSAYGLTGGQNQQAQGNPMPFVLGKFRLNPLVVGNYFTTLSNNTGEGKQYATAMFCLGQKNLVIQNIRIGDNALANNSDGGYGSLQIQTPYNASLELTNGSHSSMYSTKRYEQQIGAEAIQQSLKVVRNDGPALIAYYNSEIAKREHKIKDIKTKSGIHSNSGLSKNDKRKIEQLQNEIAGFRNLIANVPPATYAATGDYQNTFTTPANTDRFTVIFGFQGLGKYNDQNKKVNLSRNVCIIYRPAGSTSDWTIALNQTYTANKPDKALVFTFQVTPTAAELEINPTKKWEVCLFSTQAAAENAGAANKLYFQALQSQINEPVVRQAELEQLSFMTLRIQADANTQGSLQQISAECQSICPIWNGTDWNTSAPTSNPAALFRFVCQQYFENGFDENLIDNDALVELYTWCEQNGFECNAVVGDEQPMVDILIKILQSAQSKLILKGGKISIWHDVAQNNPVALLTPKNSSNFQANKILNNKINAYRIKWNDPDADYKETTTEVYLNGESRGNDDVIEDAEIFGLTNYEQVMQTGRYMLACLRLRPETYTLNVGIEHYNLPIGSRVFLASDVLGVADASGRTIGTGQDSIGAYFVIDEIIPAKTDPENPNGTPYYIRIQNVKTGEISLHEISRPALATNKMRFVDETLDLPPIGSIYAIGELDTLDCIILAKDITENDTCQLTLAGYDENIYNAMNAELPPYNPKISAGGAITGGITILESPGKSGELDYVNQYNFGGVFYDFGLYSVFNNGFKNQGTLGSYSEQPVIGTMTPRYNDARGKTINWLHLTDAQELAFLTDTLFYNTHTISFMLGKVTGTGYILKYEDLENNNRLYMEKMPDGQFRFEFDDVENYFDYDWDGEHLITYCRNIETGVITLWVDKQQIFSRDYTDVRFVLESEDETAVLGGESGDQVLTSESAYVVPVGGVTRTEQLHLMGAGITGDIATVRIWNLEFLPASVNFLYDFDYISFGVATLADYRGEFNTIPEIVKLGDTFVYTGETNAQFIKGQQYWLTEGGWVLYKII